MTPPRKRPCCHKCGTPMAGHKRPHGVPVCPEGVTPDFPRSQSDPPVKPPVAQASPLRREDKVIIPETGYYHYRNPNFVEKSHVPRPFGRPSSDSTWVSTEPADDIYIVKPERQTCFPERSWHGHDEGEGFEGNEEDWRAEKEKEYTSSSRSISPSETSSSFKRRISDMFRDYRPLASVFSVPKEDVPKLTKTAKKRGLHAGVMKKPAAVGEVSQALKQERSLWVAMGLDSRLVGSLLGAGQEEEEPEVLAEGQRNEKVGTYPVNQWSTRLSFLDVLIGGLVSGLVVFYCLSMV